MWNLPESIYDLYLIDRVYARTQSAVHAEDLVIDHHTKCEEIKHVCKVVPDVGVAIFPGAFCIKSIRLCYTTGFMVASNQMHALGVS